MKENEGKDKENHENYNFDLLIMSNDLVIFTIFGVCTSADIFKMVLKSVAVHCSSS